MCYLRAPVSRHHIHHVSSYIGFQCYTNTFKLATVPYRTLSNERPTYLVNLLHFSDISRTLRPFTSKQRFVPNTKLNISKRAFSVAASTIWIQLPIAIKSSENICNFRKKLKILYLFDIAFSTIAFRRFHAPITTFACARV